jgi:hypothetical protein
MAYTDDPMGPRRRALVDGLAGNTGISGAMPGGAGMPQIGGLMDAGAKMTPGGNAAKAGFGAGMGGIMDAAAKMAPGGSLAKPPDGATAPAATPFTFGRDSVSSILGAYDHTPAGLQKAFAEHPELAASGAKITGSKGDKIIDPTTGRAVDVIQAAGEGGKAWQWLDGDGGGGAPQGKMGGGMNPLFAGSSVAPMLQGDAQGNIQNAMQQMGALGNPSRIQQLIAALSGGQQ